MNQSNSDASLNSEIAKALLADRRKDRFWRNFRFFIYIFIIIFAITLFFIPLRFKAFKPKAIGKPYISLVRLSGFILPEQAFSAKRVIPLLNDAFSDSSSKGVVLLINSPGGSAVQASIIHDKIIQLKKKYKKEVDVVAEDALASGAYLIATAADKIYVNRDTITGSIGVIMNGFGFVDAIKKLGITRRVFIAGKNKDRLDPFAPLTEGDKEKIKKVLDIAHQNFIDDVIQGRKGKLRGSKQVLFSGDFWLGEKAVKLGLADGTDNLWAVMKKNFNVTHYKDYSIKPSLFQVLVRGVKTELHLGFASDAMTVQAIAR